MPDVAPDPTQRPVVIERGIATSAGLGASSAAGLAALIAAVLNGDHSDDTRHALTAAVVLLVVTQIGRYTQSVAAIIAQAIAKRLSPRPPVASGNIYGSASTWYVPFPPATTRPASEADADDDLAEEEGVLDIEPDDPAQLPPDQGDTGPEEPS